MCYNMYPRDEKGDKMGKIEFVGIINDFFNTEIETQENTGIPENAHFIENSFALL